MATLVSYAAAVRMAYASNKYGSGGLVGTCSYLKGMLVADTYTPSNIDTNAGVAGAIAAHEVAAGGGYTTGGEVAEKNVGIINLWGTAEVHVASFTWASLTKTFRYLVIYNIYDNALDVGVWSKPIIAYVDFGANVTTVAEKFKVQLPASGIYGLAG